MGSASLCGLGLRVMSKPLKKREPRSCPQESTCGGAGAGGGALLEAVEATQLGREGGGRGEEGAAGD